MPVAWSELCEAFVMYLIDLYLEELSKVKVFPEITITKENGVIGIDIFQL